MNKYTAKARLKVDVTMTVEAEHHQLAQDAVALEAKDAVYALVNANPRITLNGQYHIDIDDVTLVQGNTPLVSLDDGRYGYGRLYSHREQGQPDRHVFWDVEFKPATRHSHDPYFPQQSVYSVWVRGRAIPHLHITATNPTGINWQLRGDPLDWDHRMLAKVMERFYADAQTVMTEVGVAILGWLNHGA